MHVGIFSWESIELPNQLEHLKENRLQIQVICEGLRPHNSEPLKLRYSKFNQYYVICVVVLLYIKGAFL